MIDQKNEFCPDGAGIKKLLNFHPPKFSRYQGNKAELENTPPPRFIPKHELPVVFAMNNLLTHFVLNK